MDITEFRQRYPAYDSWSDDQLAEGLYNKFYQNKMSREEFEKRFRPRQYSDTEKAKYVLRAFAEGPTLGTADIAAGATNVLMNDLAGVTHGQSLGDRLKSYGRALWHATPMGLAGLFKTDEFKQGRKDFVKEQDEFKEHHPVLNTLGELAGGLASAGFGGAAGTVKAAAGTGLLRTAARGAKEGAKWGAAYGAGSGLTQYADSLDPLGALEGAAAGAALGAPAGAAFGLAGAGLNKALKTGRKLAANYQNKDYNTVAKAATEQEINRSLMQRQALLDSAGEELMRQAERAKLKKPEAAQIFRDYGEERLGRQRSTLEHAIDDQFGNLGYSQRLEKMDIARRAEDGPLYQRAIYGNDGKGVFLDGMRLTRDELDYVEKVYKTTGMKNATRGLPYNHMRVLDYAKQLMDSDISRAVRNEDGTKVANLEALKNGFLAKIDAQNPVYKQARGVFERYKTLENAMAKGKRFHTGSISERRFDLDGMSEAEKQYYVYGAREKLLENFNNFKSGKGNLTKKVFDQNTMQRLKLLPLKDRAALENTVQRESRAAENINRLLGGSQTAEREQSVGKLATNPKGSLVNWISDKIDQLLMQADPQEVARMLTDPGYLAAKRWAAMQRDINVARRVGKVHFNLLRAGGPLVKKGEDPVRVNHNSWDHIKKSPDPNSYDAIQYIRDIHAKGLERKNVENYKRRGDNFTSWDYYQKREPTPTGEKEMLVSVGNTPEYRELHNINPNVEEFLQKKFPWFSGKLDPDMPRKKQGGIFRNTPPLLNSITQNMGNVKPVSMRDFMRVLLSPQFGGIAAQVGEGADKKASAFTPRHKLGNAEDINSIAEKTGKIKGKKNNYRSMKDLLILLQRPWTLGLQGNIARENTEDK